ncbi:MAG: hypothetical protein WBA93_36815 [Microcoleaceae cyanobacterium]
MVVLHGNGEDIYFLISPYTPHLPISLESTSPYTPHLPISESPLYHYYAPPPR